VLVPVVSPLRPWGVGPTCVVFGGDLSCAGQERVSLQGHAVALDPDGNILVAGEITQSGSRSDIFVAKLAP